MISLNLKSLPGWLPVPGGRVRTGLCAVCVLLLLILMAKGGWVSVLLALPLLGLLLVCVQAPRAKLVPGTASDSSATQTLRQAIFDRSSIGVFLTDANRRIVELGEQAALMFGYTREELLGQSFRILHVSEEKYEEAHLFQKPHGARLSFNGVHLSAQGWQHPLVHGFRHAT